MPRKIPTLIAVLVIFFVIGGVSVILQKTTNTETSASSSIVPKEIMGTNSTDTSFTLVWQTDDPATGLLTLNTKSGTITAYDERDMTGKLTPYTTHSVTVKNLTPNTSYDVTIISNGKKFPTKGTAPYTVKTAPSLSTASTTSFEPAYGSVKKISGTAAEGAIVTLTLEDSQTLSSLVRSTGTWMIPLTTVRTKTLSEYLTLKGNDRLTGTLTVSMENQQSTVMIDTKNSSPVPDITLGTPYDFRNYQTKNKSKTTLASNTSSVLGAETTPTATPTSSSKDAAISITSPKDNVSIVSHRPTIQGTGISGKRVTVVIGITKPQTGTTTVGKNNIWEYTPPKTLSEGKQSVTITTEDEKGKPVAITHLFTILKSGSQVLGDATPSATLTPTPTEASVAAEPMPEPGSFIPTVVLILLGTGLLFGGAILFIL